MVLVYVAPAPLQTRIYALIVGRALRELAMTEDLP